MPPPDLYHKKQEKKPARPTSPHFGGDLKKGRGGFSFSSCVPIRMETRSRKRGGGTVGARQPRFCAKKRGEWITLFVQRRGERKEVSD